MGPLYRQAGVRGGGAAEHSRPRPGRGQSRSQSQSIRQAAHQLRGAGRDVQRALRPLPPRRAARLVTP
eukprot:1834644-Pyramimonas_sp.AAC.1